MVSGHTLFKLALLRQVGAATISSALISAASITPSAALGNDVGGTCPAGASCGYLPIVPTSLTWSQYITPVIVGTDMHQDP